MVVEFTRIGPSSYKVDMNNPQSNNPGPQCSQVNGSRYVTTGGGAYYGGGAAGGGAVAGGGIGWRFWGVLRGWLSQK